MGPENKNLLKFWAMLFFWKFFEKFESKENSLIVNLAFSIFSKMSSKVKKPQNMVKIQIWLIITYKNWFELIIMMIQIWVIIAIKIWYTLLKRLTRSGRDGIKYDL